MWRLLRFLGLVAVVAFAFRSKTSKDTTAEIQDIEPNLGGELGRFIEAINTANDENEPDFKAALERLRSKKDRVLRDARSVLEPRGPTSFGLRHSTLLAVSALRDASTLDLLSQVALNPQPLPPDPPPDAAERFHPGEERVRGEVLALDALDGIRALADAGDEAAADVLVRAAQTGSLSIKTAAMAALAARPEQAARLQQARADLPADQKHVGLVRYAAVEDVLQVQDPRRHLAGPEQGGPSIPPLPGDEARRSAAGPRSSSAPRVSKESNHA